MLRYLNKLAGLCLAATVAVNASAQDVYQSAHHDYRVVTVAEGLKSQFLTPEGKSHFFTLASAAVIFDAISQVCRADQGRGEAEEDRS